MFNKKVSRFMWVVLVLILGTVNTTGVVLAQSTNRALASSGRNAATTNEPVITYPGPTGGNANDLVMNPQNPNTLYAASNYGVFKSIDGGDHWALTSLTSATVYALGIDPINPNNIYAGTRGNGFFKSTDGGTTWTVANSSLMSSAIIYTIAVDPINPQTIYAGGRGINVDGSTSGNWGGGAYKSTDGGSTWAQINSGLPEGWVYTLAIDPTITNILYAGTHSQGVYKSFDGGATWVSRNEGLTNFPSATSPNLDNLKIRSLSISPQNPNLLLVGVWGGSSVFKTENGAEHGWANITNGLYQFHTRSVKIDPVNSSIFYAGFDTEGLYRTYQSGNDNWNPAGASYSTFAFFKEINAIVINPINNKNILIALSGAGIYRTNDGGANWAAVNKGFTATTISAMIVDNKNPLHMVAATYGSGLFQSYDKGATWSYKVWADQWDWMTSVAIDPVTANTIYISTDNYGIAVSTNNGATWNAINKNLPTSVVNIQSKSRFSTDDMHTAPQSIDAVNAFPVITTVAATATTPVTLFAGTSGHGTWYSLNGGDTWNTVDYTSAVITSIQTYPNDVNTTLITTAAQGVIRASFTGSGYNTVSLNNGLGSFDVQSAAIDVSTNPYTLYAGTTNGIYKSTDNGASWALFGLAGYEIDAIALDKPNKNIFYVGTLTAGVLKSNNGGGNWFSLALPNASVDSLILDPASDSLLFAGTNGGGIAMINQANQASSVFITNLFIRLLPPAGH